MTTAQTHLIKIYLSFFRFIVYYNLKLIAENRRNTKFDSKTNCRSNRRNNTK